MLFFQENATEPASSHNENAKASQKAGGAASAAQNSGAPAAAAKDEGAATGSQKKDDAGSKSDNVNAPADKHTTGDQSHSDEKKDTSAAQPPSGAANDASDQLVSVACALSSLPKDSRFSFPPTATALQLRGSADHVYVTELDYAAPSVPVARFRLNQAVEWPVAGEREVAHGRLGSIGVKMRKHKRGHDSTPEVSLIVVIRQEPELADQPPKLFARVRHPSEHIMPSELQTELSDLEKKEIARVAGAWVKKEHIEKAAKPTTPSESPHTSCHSPAWV